MQEAGFNRRWLTKLAAPAVALLAGLPAFGAEVPAVANEACTPALRFEMEGLAKSDGTAVLCQAVGKEGAGGLRVASEYVVTKPLKVYRLSAWNTPDYDRWWTFDLPTGSAAEYRVRNVMCSSWPVDYRTTCTLRVGTVIAIGQGQSLQGCGGPSESIQVFVAGHGAEVEAQMEKGSCTTSPSLMDP